MLNVHNQTVIKKISKRMLTANKTRHTIAILAIVLTCVLFTSLFTLVSTIGHSFEEATFRRVGGDFHGSFKAVTLEEMKALSKGTALEDYGKRLLVGMPREIPFNKSHVEVSYMDERALEGSFIKPKIGKLPKKDSMELATDSRVLKLLGIPEKIGTEVTLTYEVGQGDSLKAVTDTFILSGFWDYDMANPASHIIVSESYAVKTLEGYVAADDFDETGRWDMYLYLKDISHIEITLNEIIKETGYNEGAIAYGVNWAYLSAQIDEKMDAEILIPMIGFIALIILTGYLIVYNIFQMSVSNDVRFYGLLKTIGTSGRQIRRIVKRQAYLLAAIGIPVGLLVGHFIGSYLSPMVMQTLTYKIPHPVFNPFVFLGAALFTLFTVRLSASIPSRRAAKITAIEAVRFTEVNGLKKTQKKASKKLPMFKMAFGNLRRNRKKTILVVLSLTLSTVLVQGTYTLANGFDMDKYLEDRVVSDFILAEAAYFRNDFQERGVATVTDQEIEALKTLAPSLEGASVYAEGTAMHYVSKELYKKEYLQYNSEEMVQKMMDRESENAEGKITDRVDLYGLDPYAMGKLNVIEGDLEKINDKSINGIVAIYDTDDYGKLIPESHYAKVGDQITVQYIDEWAYVNSQTGEEGDPNKIPHEYLKSVKKSIREVTYEVVATASIPYGMSLRVYGPMPFAMSSEQLLTDGTNPFRMLYLFDVPKESVTAVEQYLSDFTNDVSPHLDYESKLIYTKEFSTFKNMFLVLGLLLSAVVGLVGILNFFNAIYNGILIRQVEFAMLESIGMTKNQIRKMLILEGIIYVGLTVTLSLILCFGLSLWMKNALNQLFWFFTYRFSALPIACILPFYMVLGVTIPYVNYKNTIKSSIVKRLREAV